MFGIGIIQDNTKRRFDWTSECVPFPDCIRRGTSPSVNSLSVKDFDNVARRFRAAGSQDLPDSHVHEAVEHLLALWETQALASTTVAADELSSRASDRVPVHSGGRAVLHPVQSRSQSRSDMNAGW